jgi:prepilin-type N-terminal cleavage/methylation domain-containing protein
MAPRAVTISARSDGSKATSGRAARPRRTAFTLIELLVVISIISLLIGIILPTLSKARAESRRTACASNLRQIGIAMRNYLDVSNDIFPFASFMPSIDPFPVESEAPIFIADVLAPHISDQSKAFKCPDDNDDNNRPEPNTGRSYYSSEKSSYEYRAFYGGRSITEVIRRRAEFTGESVHENSLWLLRDYENFHAPGGTMGARRYVYLDGHVTDFEN